MNAKDLAAGLRNVAEVMAEIGWTTRLCDLTEAQARSLVEVAVGGFLEVCTAAEIRVRGAVLMTGILDFNHREKPPEFCDRVNARIDAALVAENHGTAAT